MKWLTELIKKVRQAVARPRLIKVGENGEIVLRNIDPETVAKVEAALSNSPSIDNTSVAEGREGTTVASVEAQPDETSSPLLSPGVGVYQDPLTLDWHVVTIRFSHVSKKAEVTADLLAGKDREMLRERVKLQVIKEGMMG